MLWAPAPLVIIQPKMHRANIEFIRDREFSAFPVHRAVRISQGRWTHVVRLRATSMIISSDAMLSPGIHDFHPSLFISESGSLTIETYLSETPYSSHFVHISDLPAFCYI
jgi:hypothetical protein